MAKNIPEIICIIKQRPAREPKPQEYVRFPGVGY